MGEFIYWEHLFVVNFQQIGNTNFGEQQKNKTVHLLSNYQQLVYSEVQ